MSGKPMRLYPKHNLDIGVKSKKKGSAINSNGPRTTESNEGDNIYNLNLMNIMCR